jgi:hypothetical protein
VNDIGTLATGVTIEVSYTWAVKAVYSVTSLCLLSPSSVPYAGLPEIIASGTKSTLNLVK